MSPEILHLLLRLFCLGSGIWLASHAYQAVRRDRVQLSVLRIYQEIEREGHPIFFWLEVTFAVFFAAALLFFAVVGVA